MISSFEVGRLWPKFLLRDRNGYAMVKAMEAGLKYYLEKAQEGLDILQDVDSMPEWRLDEMAWEMNCLYDESADVEVKREWIRNAQSSERIHGTAEGVRQYLRYYFTESHIEEFWEFDGDPYTFNVSVTGIRSAENEQWIRRAVERAKNVRSRLNSIIFNGEEAAWEGRSGAAVTGIAVRDWARAVGDGNTLLVQNVEAFDVEVLERKTVRKIEQ